MIPHPVHTWVQQLVLPIMLVSELFQLYVSVHKIESEHSAKKALHNRRERLAAALTSPCPVFIVAKSWH